jgi:hypothetical protein
MRHLTFVPTLISLLAAGACSRQYVVVDANGKMVGDVIRWTIASPTTH